MLARQRVDNEYSLPTTQEVYDFARELFLKAQVTCGLLVTFVLSEASASTEFFVQLGAECIIVSLVYVERLMETAGVVLLVNNWRTILLCALLLASKVWQDLSSWNVEFSIVYPQYTLDAINRLERTFVQQLHYKLYISGDVCDVCLPWLAGFSRALWLPGSVYAKYYFALRSMSEQGNFRQRYMATIAVGPSVKRIEVKWLLVPGEAVEAVELTRCLPLQDASNTLKNQLYSRSL